MANKIDSLFREGLDPLEVTPSDQSWKQVQGQLATRKRQTWLPYSIAAAILVLIMSTLILYQYERPYVDSIAVASIDQPSPLNSPVAIVVPEQTQPAIEPKTENRSQASTPKREVITPSESLVNYELYQVATIQMDFRPAVPNVHFDYVFDLPTIDNSEKSPIKITYIADNSKKNRFNDFLTTIANEASPVDILADIRDAKNNILSRN